MIYHLFSYKYKDSTALYISSTSQSRHLFLCVFSESIGMEGYINIVKPSVLLQHENLTLLLQGLLLCDRKKYTFVPEEVMNIDIFFAAHWILTSTWLFFLAICQEQLCQFAENVCITRNKSIFILMVCILWQNYATFLILFFMLSIRIIWFHKAILSWLCAGTVFSWHWPWCKGCYNN